MIQTENCDWTKRTRNQVLDKKVALSKNVKKVYFKVKIFLQQFTHFWSQI